MLNFSTHQRYFLFSKAADMQKGFNGLSGLVRKQVPHDLMSGDVLILLINGWLKSSCSCGTVKVLPYGTNDWRRVLLEGWNRVKTLRWNWSGLTGYSVLK